MKNILLLCFLSFLLISCGSTKNTGRIHENISSKNETNPKKFEKVQSHENNNFTTSEIEETTTETHEKYLKDLKQEIIDYAKTFEGTRYKFGGTSEAGMDCSGLVYVAFQKENITLPRISRNMATKGILISFKDIEKGDLVFFKTSRKNVISHVGLVVSVKRDEVKFIHSTTRAGVIISSLDEKYWKNAFVEVRRVI